MGWLKTLKTGFKNYIATKRRKKLRRGRRPLKRRYGRTRPFSYKQVVNGVNITGVGSRFVAQTSSNRNISFEFRAADLDNWTQYSALYDQYCLTKVVVKLIPMLTQNNVQPISGTSLINPGITGTVIDTDDSNTLSTLNDYQQYESFKFQNAMSGKPIVRVITPGIKNYMISTGGASVPAGTKRKQWIDCSQGTVSHYGLKWFIDQYYSINAPQQWQVLAYYYIKFRNVR